MSGLTNPLNLLGGIGLWGYLAVAVVAGGAAAGATYYVKDNVDGRAYAKLELSQSKQETADVTASLAQLQGFIGTMNAADTNYNATLADIQRRFGLIQQEFSNAIHAKPLPPDCRPDSGRVRVLSAAIAAANAKSSGAGP